jgi:flagellum-specific ATP synthase
MHDIAEPAHIELARRLRQALSTYQQNRDLVAIGAYQRGSDPRLDAAIALWPKIQRFLQQKMHDSVDFATSVGSLATTLADTGPGAGSGSA